MVVHFEVGKLGAPTFEVGIFTSVLTGIKFDLACMEIFQEDILHANADGQKFKCRINTFKTRLSSKYFCTNKGVLTVSLVLVANHVPIDARMIGAKFNYFIE